MNESELIKRYFLRENKDECIKLGIGDDAAVIQPPANEQLVVTTDTMVEGSHFTAQSKPYDIATKLMAVNLSDIAAMGATPKWATLTVTLSVIDELWLHSFSDGLFSYLDRYQVSLVGGDVTKGEQTNVAIQLIGIVPTQKELRRSGAVLNDDIYVTGEIGCAAQAVRILYENNQNPSHLHENSILSAEQKNALYAPEPRIEVGRALRDIATSAIDISDGLLHELNILCEQSLLGAALTLDQLPIAKNCEMNLALTGGDDYELLFTANKEARDTINTIAQQHNCTITRIGTMNLTTKIELFYENKLFAMPKKLGFDHFIGATDGK